MSPHGSIVYRRNYISCAAAPDLSLATHVPHRQIAGRDRGGGSRTGDDWREALRFCNDRSARVRRRYSSISRNCCSSFAIFSFAVCWNCSSTISTRNRRYFMICIASSTRSFLLRMTAIPTSFKLDGGTTFLFSDNFILAPAGPAMKATRSCGRRSPLAEQVAKALRARHLVACHAPLCAIARPVPKGADRVKLIV